MPKYRAFIAMEFEPDENGFLEWENFDPDYDTPRTEEQIQRFFADELYEYLTQNLEYDAITVEVIEE